MTQEELKKFENDIENLSKEISRIYEDIEIFTLQMKKRAKKLREKRARLAKRVKWHYFSERHYEKKDYSKTLAFEMFGKRYKDLTIEELREYKKVITRKVREKYKKGE
jgi:septal ring factor EnvC (AmiA/AmiB activator)